MGCWAIHKSNQIKSNQGSNSSRHKRCFSSLQHLERLWPHPNFPEGKVTGLWSWLFTSGADFRNEWRYPSAPPICFYVMDRSNFALCSWLILWNLTLFNSCQLGDHVWFCAVNISIAFLCRVLTGVQWCVASWLHLVLILCW